MEAQSILDHVVTIVVAVLASSGFWALLEYKLRNRKELDKQQEMQTNLLMGLAHDRIVFLALKYVEQGCITHAEYENLSAFLYKPYLALGGNGIVKRLMAEIDKLPITPSDIKSLNREGDSNV